MSASFRWIGVDELIAQFARLPEDLAEAAAPDVIGAAQTSKATIRAGYPHRTGNLRDGLRVEVTRDAGMVKAVVVNTSPHAAVFERGSQARHTGIGANRGSMPANHLFTAEVIRARRRLEATAIPRVLRETGLTVYGVA